MQYVTYFETLFSIFNIKLFLKKNLLDLSLILKILKIMYFKFQMISNKIIIARGVNMVAKQ